MNLVKIYFFFCFFFVIGSHDAALRNFISKIVSKYRFVEKSDLEFSEWPISISGGYVLSFQIDGFRFLGSSLSSNNLVFEWMVFPASDVIPLKDFVTLSPEGFWWNPETHEILRYVETGGEGGYVISTLLSEEGISSQAFDVSHEEVTNGMGGSVPPKKGFYFFRPVVSIATLYDLLNHGTKAWKRFSLAEDGSNYSLPEGKLLLSADADRRNDFSNFTPEIALALLSRMPAPPLITRKAIRISRLIRALTNRLIPSKCPMVLRRVFKRREY